MKISPIHCNSSVNSKYSNRIKPTFKGVIQDVLLFCEKELQIREKNKNRLRLYLKQNKNILGFYRNKLENTANPFLRHNDEFQEIKSYFYHVNPLYMDSKNSILDVSKLLKRDIAYVTYREDFIEFPLTGTKRKVKLPSTVAISLDEKTGKYEEVMNLDNNFSSFGCYVDKNGTSYADTIKIYDVNNCNSPEFRFLKFNGCDCTVFENAKIDTNGNINADTLITLKKNPNGKLEIKDIIVNPIVTQPFMNNVSKISDNDELNWRVSIISQSKLTKIDSQDYDSTKDYIKKSQMQIKCREVYSPLKGMRGEYGFTMRPYYEGSKEHLCMLNHRISDDEFDICEYKEVKKL